MSKQEVFEVSVSTFDEALGWAACYAVCTERGRMVKEAIIAAISIARGLWFNVLPCHAVASLDKTFNYPKQAAY